MIFDFKRAYDIARNTVVSFIADDCYTKASALTYYVLLSIVPVFAVLFGIAKGFGFQEALEEEIYKRFAEQPELMEKLIHFAYSWLQNVQGGLIAGIGTILLFWTVLGLLNSIEGALNSIWKVKKQRAYHRKISNYLASMIIAPLILVAVSSINLFLTKTSHEESQNAFIHAVNPILLFLVNISPFFLSWILFTFVYKFTPNVKVDLKAALIAGILAGTAFQLWQWAYIKFQMTATSYGVIYGSFAALPLFLIWVQTSWLILLAGAELTVEIENHVYIPGRSYMLLTRKVTALLITFRCIEAFTKGIPPYTDRTLAPVVGLPLQDVQEQIELLQKAGILSPVWLSNNSIGYQPGRDTHTITMKSVCDAIELDHQISAYVPDSVELNKFQNYLKKVDTLVSQLESDQLIYP